MGRAAAPSQRDESARTLVLHALFFVSGAAGLGYQMVWARLFGAGLGHEVPALLGVVAACLGGMAIGAWGLQARLCRSQQPVFWYAGLELLIGIWGAASGWLVPPATAWACLVLGPEPSAFAQWAVAFALPLLLLLPATSAMGATLPAMERGLAAWRRGGRWVGGLYAANTAGAWTGTLGSAYLLLPWLGLRHSAVALGISSLACAAGAWGLTLGGHGSAPSRSAEPPRTSSKENDSETLTAARWRCTAFCCGILGLGFQVVTVRMLSQLLENTFYTYATALATYLAATATGAAVYQRWWRGARTRLWLATLLYAQAFACVLSAWVAPGLSGFYRGMRGLLGDSLLGVLGGEMAAASMVLGLPALLMGATFSHLAQRAALDGCVGQASALNMLGSALAVGLFGVWFLPLLGLKGAIILITVGYLLCLPPLRRPVWLALAVMLPPAGLIFLPSLRLADLPERATVTAFREGRLATVTVVRTPDNHRSLRVNGRLQMGGTAAAQAERRQAHLPLLLHPHPGRGLFLGPGTGITLGAAARHPGLRVDGVELVPEVLEELGQFEPENGGVRTNPAVRLVVADARRFVRTTRDRYDVVVADLFHPAQDGAGFLYTREHFEAIRQRLATGGVFCQWLPLHQLDELTLRSIVRTFLEVFPEAQALLLHFNVDIPVVGLLGTESALSVSWERLQQRMADPRLLEALRGVGVDRPMQLLGCLAAEAGGLRRFASDAPLCTDDAPFVLFAAPRQASRQANQAGQLLLTFLDQVRGSTDPLSSLSSLTREPAGERIRQNVRGFIAARDVYLRGLGAEASGNLGAAIERYLESAQQSLFFTPAYARLVGIIQVLAATDRPRARELFRRLESAQPNQPLARQLAPLWEDQP